MTPLDVRRAVALCFGQLPDVGSGRIRRLLGAGEAAEAWAGVLAGQPPLAGIDADLARRWQLDARALDLENELQRHRDAGVGVTTIGDDDYPEPLSYDRTPPGVLVWRGDLGLLGSLMVGIVGTRRCTRYGRDVAFDLGAGLSEAGVSVVSGLALGIDGAAHEGVLSIDGGASPIAVVAGGLDRIYPRRHAALWRSVAEQGVVISETPLGVDPVPWRFPARNRIIAALGQVLVVVESGFAGGSMHTVRQADDRGRTVLAVPGSVRSPASAGTNLLLSEGCPPCRDVDDVLVALGLVGGRGVESAEAGGERDVKRADRSPLSSEEAGALDALVAGPSTLDQLVLRTGLSTAALAVAVDELESAGRVVVRDGWFEAVGQQR